MGCVVRGAHLDFIFLLLQQIDLGRLCKPGPVPAIGDGDVREIKIAIPPIKEQEAFVKLVRAEVEPLKAIISSLQNELSLFREYHIRLIADVVTGKLDVREAAAQLPAEDQELPPIDELDESGDLYEDGLVDPDEVPEDPEP